MDPEPNPKVQVPTKGGKRGKRGQSKLSPSRIKSQLAAEQVLKLRIAGASFPEIARQLGISVTWAWESCRNAILRTLQEPAEEVRKLEAERLDRLMLAQWQLAVAGDKDAAQMAIKIMERRAKLLGLDAPTTTVQAVHFPGSEILSKDDAELLEIIRGPKAKREEQRKAKGLDTEPEGAADGEPGPSDGQAR